MNRKLRRASGAGPTGGAKGHASKIVHAAAIRSAEALLGQKKWDEAAGVYEGILKSQPDNAAALYNLGALLASFYNGNSAILPEDLARAAQCFTRCLKIRPQDADAMAALAFVRMMQGSMDEALPLMEKARRGGLPPKILARMGDSYKKAGDLATAEECFLEALRRQPDFVSAYYGLSLQNGLKAGSAEFARLQDLAARKEALAAEDRLFCEFALASCYLANGDPDRAFAHYAAGNRLQRGMYHGYSVDRFERHAATLPLLFSKEFIGSFRGRAGNAGKRQIFVVGMPRSGSTLVDQILSSHPAVGSIGEAPYLCKSLPPLPPGELPGFSVSDGSGLSRGLVSGLSPAVLDGIAKKYQSLVRASGAKGDRIVDKMLFNYLWIGVIRLALPEAKIIHCTRDPRDIGLSIWQILFTADLPWAYDLSEIGRYYNAYRKIMAHWDSVFPGEIHEANYEAMVQDQEGETRRLLDFCGLPWDERCLRFYETKRAVQTASHAQVRKPVYKDSIGKWKKHEKHLTPLLEALGKE